MCSPAPLQIGNRVWLDTDSDGIQDADEVGIANVRLYLFKNGTQVGTAVTNAQGLYYFQGSGTDSNTNDNTGIVSGGLLPNMAYEIRLDKTQTALTSYSMSTANAGTNDQVDSDGIMSGNNAVISLTTGDAGVSDHTFDFGFTPAPPTVIRQCIAVPITGGCSSVAAPGYNFYMDGLVAGNPYFYFTGNTALFTEYSNGTATVTGSIVHQVSTNVGFDISMNFNSKVAGGTAPYNTCYTYNTSDWATYGGYSGKFTGKNQAAGAVINITPRANGLIVGTGANLEQKNNLGASAWYTMAIQSQPTTGLVLGNATQGDLGFNIVCDDIGDLELSKTANPAAVTQGGQTTFTLSLVNKGPKATTNVTVKDVLPAGVTFVSAAPSQGSYNNTTGIWTVGNLAVNQTVTLQITVTANSNSQNCAEVATSSAVDLDSTPGNNSTTEDDDACASVTVTPRIDLEVTKVADNMTPAQGGTVNFTVSVTNRGPSQATGVQLKDVLPAGLVFVSSTPSQGSYNNTTGVWAVGTLAVNATATLQIKVTANAAGKNCAEISAADQTDVDSTPNNYNPATGLPNEDDDDCKEIGVTPKIDLELTKTVNATSANIGQDVTWTVTLVNKGPSNATGVTVREAVPAGTTFVSATPSQGTYNQAASIWNVGNLAVNQTVTLALVTKVNQTGTITNYAEVNAANETDIDSTPGNGSTNEDDDDSKSLNGTGKIDLELTKTVDNTAPNYGDNVVFTINVRNVGQIAATGVTVKDVLPAGLVYVGATPSVGSFANATGIWTIGNLAVNASASLQITAKVNTTAAVTNYAQVNAANETDIDSTPGNNSTNEDDDDQVTIDPKAQVDLELTKLVDKTTASVGDVVTFTVSVVNKGPNATAGVTVDDLLPNGLAFVSATPTVGSYNNTTGIWTIGQLAKDATASMVIKAIANATAKNCAEVETANQQDIDSTPGNFNPVTESPNEDDDDCKTVTVSPKIDLELTKVVDNASPVAGNAVTFTISVVNKGPSNATNVNVKDLLPAGLTYLSSTPSVGTYNAATGVWTIGSINANVTRTLTITATATGTPTMATNCAEVSGATEADADSTPGNAGSVHEDDDACAKVTTSPQRIDLELTKAVNNASPAIGGTVSFTVTVTNKGPQNATGVAVDDVLPGGFQYVSNSGGYNPSTGIWTIGNLNVNQTATLTITGTATGSPMTVKNCAEVGTADQLDVDSTPRNNVQTEDDYGCATFSVQPRIDLEVNKTANRTSVPVGGTATFTISVVNKGPSQATGVALKDVLPAGATYVSASPSQGTYSNTTGVWTVGTLAESADAAEKARTDGNGIHLNVDSTFSLPGDLLLGDCSEGYFSSLWTLIEVLIHEYAHYRRDTGLVGRVLRRIPDTFFGGLALMLGSLTGRTMRTWRWHEMRAYHFGYTMLRTLRHFVFMLDVTDAECLPCPKQHLIYSDEACRRQDPHSTYGN